MSRKKTPPTTKTSPTSDARNNGILSVLHFAFSLIALSLSVFVIEKVVAPLYGSVATNLYLENVVGTLSVISMVLPLPHSLGSAQGTVLAGLLCIAPCVLHGIAALTTRLDNPQIGPILTYLPVLAPIVFAATDRIRGNIAEKRHTLKALSGIALSVFTLRTQHFWSRIPYSASVFPLLPLGWILALLEKLSSNGSATKSEKKRKFNYGGFILPFMLTVLALSQPPLRFHTFPYTHPNGLLRIVSSTPSVTGRIVVADEYTHGFRFLRADHSLLGGVWINDRYLVRMDENSDFPRDKDGTKLGDSIYSAFVLQDAARLQERDKPHQNALIIGLGVGIAAQAFMKHGLSTSIVEVDPAVYSAAREYFGLPEPAAVYIEDARSWVHRQASLNNGTYDIIVHDCFSGGGVPAHIFTSEFWQDLKEVLTPDGILAVNYAGVIGSESSKAVFLTLKKNFGQCRIFHDYRTDASDEQLSSEFINMVFFCSPSPRPLTFRPATRDDYLSSYLREHVLQVLPDREVRSELILGDLAPEREVDFILTDEHNPLGAWQDKGALDHWKVMRSILPDYVWSTY